ncbi:MAG TPA: class E sortase [Acidimicrobiales bacterium]|nr:class E sortase [Acidimicrobiales bacterium]
MRCRSVLVAAILALTGACSSPTSRAMIGSADPPAPAVTVTVPPRPPPTYADPTRPPPGPPLPSPIPIPADDYAPEPVVEIGSIEIPAIGLKHRMFQGVTLNNIDEGPSHWTGSALPGEMGNAVFAGHRASNTQPFRRIDALAPGDRVIFSIRGTRSTYRVTGHLVVRPADSWIADQTTAYTATLYACHPVGSTAERYVVRLALVP